jgi:hypothetical protein
MPTGINKNVMNYNSIIVQAVKTEYGFYAEQFSSDLNPT